MSFSDLIDKLSQALNIDEITDISEQNKSNQTKN